MRSESGERAREQENTVPPRTCVLKIDKDCIVDYDWTRDYIRLVISTCKRFAVKVLRIRASRSCRKGVHYYIDINPPVEAELANRLQYLLGDDCQRVDFNRARIASGLGEWSKLFEVAGRRLTTIYRRTAS